MSDSSTLDRRAVIGAILKGTAAAAATGAMVVASKDAAAANCSGQIETGDVKFVGAELRDILKSTGGTNALNDLADDVSLSSLSDDELVTLIKFTRKVRWMRGLGAVSDGPAAYHY